MGKNTKGFGALEDLLILVIVGMLGFVGWFVYHSRSQTKPAEQTSQPPQTAVVTTFEACAKAGNPIQESYPEVCVTKDGKHFTNESQKQYLVITEWGIRVPLTSGTTDLAYTYTKNETYESVSFTFKRLQDAGICKTDVGVSLTRNKTQNQPPYDISNPEAIAQVAGTYYYPAYGSMPCYDNTNASQMKAVNAINKGDLKAAVLGAIKNLELNPGSSY